LVAVSGFGGCAITLDVVSAFETVGGGTTAAVPTVDVLG
jgi:hypothetical protein